MSKSRLVCMPWFIDTQGKSMPAALERKLKKEANKKGIKDKDAYVYGTLRKTGWKPNREKKMNAPTKLVRLSEINNQLDPIISFAYDDEHDKTHPYQKAAETGAVIGGVAGAGYLGHRAIQQAGGYGASLEAGKSAFLRGARGTGLQGVAKGPGRFIGHQAGKGYGLLSRSFPSVIKALSARMDEIRFQGIPAMGAALAEQAAKKVPSWLSTIGKRTLTAGAIGAGVGAAGGAFTGATTGTGVGQGALKGAAIGGVGGAGLGAAATAGAPYLSRYFGKNPSEFGKGFISELDPALRKAGYKGALGSMPATGMSSADKTIHFDEDQAQLPAKKVPNQLEPFSATPETKIAQEQFPAGKSPGMQRDPTAEVLKLPFPELMRLLNKRNYLQTQYRGFSKLGKLIEMGSKLDGIIK